MKARSTAPTPRITDRQSIELPAGTGAKPMYKNIAWCTGLGITEEGDWNGGILGNDHAARRCFNLS
jgi:hypothetical protein